MKDVEDTLSDVFGVGAFAIEKGDAEAVGFVFHLSGTVVALDKDAEFLLFVVSPPGGVLAGEHFGGVLAVIVNDFMTDDEGQLGFVVGMSHETGVDEYHALTSGEGVDFGTFHRIETKVSA